MHSPRFFSSVRNLSNISWKPTGKLQQTLASEISRSGTALHSAASSTANLFPAMAGEGRFFVCGGDRRSRIPASIDCVMEATLCTTLGRGDGGEKIRTVEHLLSALEAAGVDNCGIEIVGGDEVPLLDGSAREWVEAIENAGLCVAKDYNGNTMDKLAPFLDEPMHVWRNDSFVAAFPSPKVQITYGIDFPQVPAIGRQWFSCFPMDESAYTKEIASARTFGIYEEVEKLRKAGLIQGGSMENATVCSAKSGWLNPPLRFQDEPCRHKVLDLIGDLSIFARNGSQGLPVAHIIAYKAGHSLHAEFVRRLSGSH
ncbi:probable UDP-3-O-acyl-N-acetylglucosamine deacetylase 1, mitochondrial [Magnolia sinica]|uniref:probable UDP-3-O-acyl-N-acetylglucosamine deacetylase 1, mitochondrial n=1 Tax=Magnolia sinica TaxID=86752 RepID=UPI00265B1670|nr:probable UDP-3-O-acyl-N-acetylglucosamine deacetylase 1, mitochondrial [Magnolia sinica]